MTLKVCLRSAPTLSGCFHSCPSMMCVAAFAPGTTAPSTAVVTKTRLPQTTGLEWPLPGRGVFQRTLFVSPAAELSGIVTASANRRRAKRTKEIFADGFTVCSFKADVIESEINRGGQDVRDLKNPISNPVFPIL